MAVVTSERASARIGGAITRAAAAVCRPFSGKHRRLFRILAGVAAVAVVALVMLVVFRPSSDETLQPWRFSQDQRRVLHAFGPPAAFMVGYASDLSAATPKGEDPPLVRFETWSYPQMGSEFFFRNGVFARRDTIPTPRQKIRSAALRPDAFVAGMKPEDVSKIVRAKPDKAGSVMPSVFKDLEVQSYRGQLVAGYQDGRLVMVQMTPVVVDGGAK